MDIYEPARQRPGAPAVVFFHGGAWQFGDKEHLCNVGVALARRGFTTFVPNYRLAPGARHPCQIEDAATVIAWAGRRLSRAGRRAALVVAGHSAGAHLATLLALDPRWLLAHGRGATKLIVAAIGLAGIYDLNADIDDDVPDGGMAAFVRPAFPRAPSRKAASPISHVSRAHLPLLLIDAGADTRAMRAQTRAFVRALRASGAKPRATTTAVSHFELVERVGRRGDPTTQVIAAFVRSVGW